VWDVISEPGGDVCHRCASPREPARVFSDAREALRLPYEQRVAATDDFDPAGALRRAIRRRAKHRVLASLPSPAIRPYGYGGRLQQGRRRELHELTRAAHPSVVDRLPVMASGSPAWVERARACLVEGDYPPTTHCLVEEYPTVKVEGGRSCRVDLGVFDRQSGRLVAVVEVGDLSQDGKLERIEQALPGVRVIWLPKGDLLAPDLDRFRLPRFRNWSVDESQRCAGAAHPHRRNGQSARDATSRVGCPPPPIGNQND
jgi:hypothetical protein